MVLLLSIRTRYISQLPQKLDHDLRIIAESKNPFDDLLTVIADENRLEILPGEFEGRGILHPLFSLMRWYFKSRNAVCFTTGVGLRQNMGSKYKLENDHIFPYSKLKGIGYGKGNRIKYSLAQEFTNRAILTQVANRSKSDTLAEDYLKSVKKQFPNALALQCIPDDEELWKLVKYESFLRARRQTLAAELNSFLEGITKTEETEVPVSLEELIAEGESSELEFKSSLRWDMKENRVNKKLEEVIAKSISAFANSEGGTLLIGVSDDGEIVGLEHDYSSLSGDRDKFELHLGNLIRQQFGVSFYSTKLKVSFPELGDQEICMIEISPSNQPLVVKVKDKNGKVAEKFFVRAGNSSQEVPLSEMNSYFAERFANV